MLEQSNAAISALKLSNTVVLMRYVSHFLLIIPFNSFRGGGVFQIRVGSQINNPRKKASRPDR